MRTPDDGNSLNTHYDPLATQFMTGGQMGYMPQAQFMTDSSYGAFRTMPGYGAPQSMQRPTMWQSYLTMNHGTLPGMGFLGPYVTNTYNPAMDQMKLQTMAARRFSSGSVAGGGAIADYGVGMLGGALGGAMFGPLGALAGMLMSPKVSSGLVDRIGQSQRIQNQTMPLVTFGSDVSGMGQGFSMTAANRYDSGIRKMAAGDLVFKEEDYRSMSKMGMQAGMFDYANNASQYKDILKKLRSNFKVMMEVYETSDFGEISKHMRRLQTMGADQSSMQGIARNENMFSRMAGLSHSDMINTYGSQGALIYSQMGMTGYQGSLANMANAGMATAAQRLGLVNPGEVARAGGMSGMVQSATSNQASAWSKIQDFILPYAANANFTGLDPEKMKNLGKGGLFEMMQESGGRMRGVNDFAAYSANKGNIEADFQKQFGATSMALLLAKFAEEIGKKIGASGSRQDVMFAGYKAWGMDPEEARRQSKLYSNTDMLTQARDQAETEQRKLRMNSHEEYLRNSGWINRTKRRLSTAYNEVGEMAFGGLSDMYSQYQTQQENRITGGGKVYNFGVGATPQWEGGGATGRVSSKYESNGNAGVIAADSNGFSYGTHQISTPNMEGFLGSLPEDLRGQFRGLAVNSAPFKAKWRELAKNPAFAAAQSAWNKKNNVDPLMASLAKKHGYTNMGAGYEELVYSVGTQMGPQYGADVFANAGLKAGDSEHTIIDKVQNERAKLGYFKTAIAKGTLSPEAHLRRIKNERADLHAAANAPPKDPALTGLNGADLSVWSSRTGRETDSFLNNTARSGDASASTLKSGMSALGAYNITEAHLTHSTMTEINDASDVTGESLRRVLGKAVRAANPGMRPEAVQNAVSKLVSNNDVQTVVGAKARSNNGDNFSNDVYAFNNERGADALNRSRETSEQRWKTMGKDIESYSPKNTIWGSNGGGLFGRDHSSTSTMKSLMGESSRSIAISEFVRLISLLGSEGITKEKTEQIQAQAYTLGEMIGLSYMEIWRCFESGSLTKGAKIAISEKTHLSTAKIDQLATIGTANAKATPIGDAEINGTIEKVSATMTRQSRYTIMGKMDDAAAILKSAGTSIDMLQSGEDVSRVLAGVKKGDPAFALLTGMKEYYDSGAKGGYAPKLDLRHVASQFSGLLKATGGSDGGPKTPERPGDSEVSAQLVSSMDALTKAIEENTGVIKNPGVSTPGPIMQAPVTNSGSSPPDRTQDPSTRKGHWQH